MIGAVKPVFTLDKLGPSVRARTTMLLSITPEILGVIFRAAGKAMMGAMVCKKLQALLPLHAKGLRWHIKGLIPNAECD
eukprot:3273408-Rhodomonas_salina.1